ncbi:hypothetical protein OIU76_023253 [Salix suchowensis]|nr:hypothetical protein OIU76_023253 [Salix suchowensis]
MQVFFSHFGVEGLIVSAMCAAAQAVVSPKQSQHLWHQLAMFFRDELLSWSWRRPLGLNLGPATSGSSMNPADFKHKVTTNGDHVISRITKIAPQSLSEEAKPSCIPHVVVRLKGKLPDLHLIYNSFESSSHTFFTEENAVDPPQSVQRGVTELVEAALTPRNLCMMDPTWHPWF